MSIDLVAAVTARLKLQVAALQNRVEGAAELAALVDKNKLPQRTPAAFVLPLAQDGEANAAATGGHRQRVRETVGVILAVRHAGDATGKHQVAAFVPLLNAVRDALAGWPPDPGYDTFDFLRGRLVGLAGGAALQQLDFRTAWWLIK